MPEELSYNFDFHGNQHVTIEASAGTGKTYTIVKILSELIRQKIRLEEVAVVTFTEKAAGELTDRIREEFSKKDNEPILQKALLGMPHAVMGTIHSFCRTILKQYATFADRSGSFEELEDEEKIFDKIFTLFWKRLEILQPELFLRVLKQSGFDTFKEFIWKLHSRLKGRCPEIETPNYQMAEELLEKLKLLLPASEVKTKGKTISELYRFNKTVQFPEDFTYFESTFFTAAGEPRKRESNEILKSKKITEDELIALLMELKSYWGYLQNYEILAFLVEGGCSFTEVFHAFMKESDTFSKDDLIVRTRDLLKNNNEVRAAVRKKFKYIIVDECQDTSPIQIDLFLSLFKDSTSGLVFVGDPKQSIYRFLDADVKNYRRAQEKIGGARLVLSRTFRTSNRLMQSLNAIFSNMEDLEYNHVDSARKMESDFSPLIFLLPEDISMLGNADAIARDEADRIAAAIVTLVDPVNGYTIYENDEENRKRNLRLGDIAILYPKGSRKMVLLRALAQRGIPASIYKGNDLYRNSIVIAISNLLNAIADPDDTLSLYKALVSDLFLVNRVHLTEFPDYENGSVDEEVNRIFETLQDARAMRYQVDIGTLVMDILEKNHVLYHLSCGFDGRRNLANLHHILDIIAADQIRDGLSFDDVVEQFRKNIKTGKDQEIRLDIDPEADGNNMVRIMTVHASKGLEFPVVILYGLDIADKSRSEIYLHDKALATNKIRVEFEFAGMTTPGYKKFVTKNLQEMREEKKRLLYVAMTRPKDLLVLPLSPPSNKFTENSILYHIFENMGIKQKLIADGLAVEWKERANEILAPAVLSHQYTLLPNWESIIDRISNLDIKNHIGIPLYSYTSLSRHVPMPEKELILEDQNTEDSVEEETQDRFLEEMYWREKKSIGRIFGDTCHKILEAMNHLVWDQKNVKEILAVTVETFYQQSNLIESEHYSSEVMFELCYSALSHNYILNEKESYFLQWEHRQSEKSFYFSEKSSYFFGIGDLLFSFDEKYYLLDWKTNRLDDYSLSNIYEKTISMYSHQINLYCYNLFLNLCFGIDSMEARKDIWESSFGGMVFVYLRGLQHTESYVTIKPDFSEMISFQETYSKELHEI